jgi:hypothetical protein
MRKTTSRKAKRTAGRAVMNSKHPTATYPRSRLKLPKGVDPQRKRAAPRTKKNPSAKPEQAQFEFEIEQAKRKVAKAKRAVAAAKRNGPVEKSAAAALRAEKFERLLAAKRRAKASKKNARSCANPAAPRMMPESACAATVNKFADDLNAGMYDDPIGPATDNTPIEQWPKYVEAVVFAGELDKLLSTFRHHAAVSNAAARMTDALRALKQRASDRKRAAPTPAGVRSTSKGRHNATTTRRPKASPKKADFSRITRMFKEYVSVFAKRYPKVALIGLKVDPSIHDTARHFAMTGPLPGDDYPTVRIAPELAFEPVTVQRGIIVHEIGHSVFQLGYARAPKGYDANERANDKLAEAATGLKIYYDSRGVEVAGKGAKGTRPRPAGLR